jgi:tetraacyldisaccharide 4'-kinase
MGYDVHALRFADHHRYAPEDWERVREAVGGCGAAAVVTTEKDAVKLPPPPANMPPVHVLQCELGLVEGHPHVEALVEALAR